MKTCKKTKHNIRRIIDEKEMLLFPSVDQEMFFQMDYISLNYFESINIFAFLRINRKDVCYVDFYIYDSLSGKPKRYIVCPGYCLGQQEGEFLDYIRSSKSLFHIGDKKEFLSRLKKYLPMYRVVENNRFAIVFEGLYFSMFSGDLRELLYKIEGLHNIAFNIKEFEGVQIQTDEKNTNIKNALGISLSCLKHFSKGNDYLYLANQQWRLRISKVFKRYHGVINQCSYMNKYQWEYLENLLQQEEGMKGKFPSKFNRNLFNNLGVIDDEVYFDEYVRYFKLLDCLGNSIKRNSKIPKYDEVSFENQRLETLIKIVEKEELYNSIWNITYNRTKYLEEKDEEYTVSIAKSLKEYIAFTKPLHNCLLNVRFIKRILLQDSIVLFIKNDDREYDFAVEIIEESGKKRVVEAYGIQNRHLILPEFIFLKDYCERWNIEFDVGELLEIYEEDPYSFGVNEDVYEWLESIS